jgi:hypothetical protein
MPAARPSSRAMFSRGCGPAAWPQIALDMGVGNRSYGMPSSRKESLHFLFGCASLLRPRQGNQQGITNLGSGADAAPSENRD